MLFGIITYILNSQYDIIIIMVLTSQYDIVTYSINVLVILLMGGGWRVGYVCAFSRTLTL